MPINSFLYPAPSTPSFVYNVANSLRFNGGSSDYLNRTNVASPTNQFKWTFSFWLKISDITDAQGSGNQMLFSDFTDASNRGTIFLESDDTLVISDRISNSFTFKYQTTRKFRDVSAWYHIVTSYDLDNGTNADRMKIYVNGAGPYTGSFQSDQRNLMKTFKFKHISNIDNILRE